MRRGSNRLYSGLIIWGLYLDVYMLTWAMTSRIKGIAEQERVIWPRYRALNC